MPPGRTAPAQQTAGRPRHKLSGPPQLDFPPVRNGLDYLDSAVDHLDENETGITTRDVKYAVLHLQAAVEVLFKARLLAEHWTLVFADVHQATRKKLDSADFKSVTTEAAIVRLRNIVGVPISDEEEKALKNLREDRNKLQHFGLTHDAHAVEARTAAVLDFLIRFCEQQLVPCLTNEEEKHEADKGLLRLRVGLNTIDSFVRKRMNRIGGELKAERVEDRTIRCPGCTQLALVLAPSASPSPDDWDSTATCRFCSSEWDTIVLAGYFSDAEHDEPGAWNTCPHCDRWALGSDVPVRSNPAMPVYFCFSCAVALPALLPCTRCERPVDAVHVTGPVVCGSCEMDLEVERDYYENPRDYGYGEEQE
ncbi:serine/arginine repetitive matrix protein 1 [Streptomyces sp. NPDC056543]|uniref:serine/arginine repetitive matrix protein 1 n=1 Tax=unclassified Streptomyces TaxID=2593676 RepID=UPI00368300BE